MLSEAELETNQDYENQFIDTKVLIENMDSESKSEMNIVI